MIFYSKIVNKPNAVIKEVRDGFKLISQKKLCTFIEGKLETTDPTLIAILQKRPDLFRTDKPWSVMLNWRTTKEGIKLLKQGEELGIDCIHIRECYLKQRIREILHPKKKNEPEAPEVNEKKIIDNTIPKPKPKVDYKAMMKLAKEAGIRGHGVKKEILRKTLKEKGVI